MKAIVISLATLVAIGLIATGCDGRKEIATDEGHAIDALEILRKAEHRLEGQGKDYWTGDVATLFKLGVIPKEIAEADASPTKLGSLVSKPIPYHGYYFIALDWNDAGEKPVEYRQDTDGKSGKVHNKEMAGFCAFPSTPGRGRTFLDGIPHALLSHGSGERVTRWPSHQERKANWSIID